ncbi:uncharacterized protein LOC117113469 isoform X2 [Anneissia japonica]|uniref:uncharacterized protein LOC117113469 isoform X2 n=1 Tax=Anneissia japonica TaxID=1529436 RepID=UPI00142575A2|nr:uncharacterized protein LOC117113469 isoform X2 [Anneissia japonica]
MFHDPDDDVPRRQVNPTTLSFSSLNPHLHHMKEDIIVNIENNTEVFSIPATDGHEAIMMLHDFTNRYTAYLLVEQELCFVKDINPLLMIPFFLFQVLLNPLYLLQEYFVTRDSYIAIPPPLDSLSTFGAEIDSMCGSVPTFWLEEMNDEYETVDITELPWWDWGYPEWFNRRRRSVKGKLKKIQVFDSDEKVHDMKILFKSPSN